MRSPGILLVFCLLAFAPSAAAECAWLLWSSAADPDLQPAAREKGWKIVSAFGSQHECAQRRAAMLARWKDEAQRTARLGGLDVSAEFLEPDGRVTLFREAGKVVLAQNERIVCLPDTVDPRGPKVR